MNPDVSNLSYLWHVLPDLLSGLKLSLEATGLSMAIALVIGVPICLLRVSRHWLPRAIGFSYITAIRNTPLLAQLYVYFYILPNYGVLLSPLTVGVFGLATQFSAYVAESYRGGLESVPQGQWEAAAAVGLGRIDTLWRVVAPQAIRPAIPALANNLLSMFKDTSVLTAVTVLELFATTESLTSESFRYTLLYSVLGLIYLMFCYPAGRIVARLERRLVSPDV